MAGGLRDTIMGSFHAGRTLRPIVQMFSVAVFLAFAIATFGGHALAQGAVRSVHGDWQIRCDTPPGAQSEQCALMQSVTAEDRPNVGLTVIVLKTADQKSRLMRVVAPLGVLLPSGLGDAVLGDGHAVNETGRSPRAGQTVRVGISTTVEMASPTKSTI